MISQSWRQGFNPALWRQGFSPAICLVAILACASVALAHEGHLHKVMGTVVSADATKVDVKGTDGKTLSLVVDGSTKVVRGATVIKSAELKVDERVVASYMPMKGPNGAEMLMAKEVKAAAAPAAAPPAK
jgi:hypothetical protein